MEARLRWAVRINHWHPGTEEWNFLLNLLPQSDRKQVGAFKFREDQKRHLLSQLLQRKCIATALGIPWGRIHIIRTMGKKPWVDCDGFDKDHAPNFNFNVSHEGDYVALASEPLCICGIDVAAPQQFRGQRKVPFDELLDSLSPIFTAKEITAIREAGATDTERESAFRRFWSLKEALVKARGDGLGFELSRAEFTVEQTDSGWSATVAIDGAHKPRWRFYLQEMSAGHWISVSRGPPEDIVDAWGEFTDSLGARKLSDLQMKMALQSPNPPFEVLQPGDLVPSHLLEKYEEITNQVCKPDTPKRSSPE